MYVKYFHSILLRIVFFLKKSEQQQPEYRYTLPNGILTNEQREFYEKNGFIVIRNLVSPETLEKYR
jgi:phytanoyl-CoA hydroxylase